MAVLYDVPANQLISTVAKDFEKNNSIKPPVWAANVKTGMHKEMPPIDEKWWFTRCASVLRKVYTEGPVGVSRLRSCYGGGKDRGAKPYAFVKGSGSIIRNALIQLEAAGMVRQAKEGRVVTPQGQSYLDNHANDIKKGLVADIPGLDKY
ncbi:MAG: 30S ribosomal protein S19e [Methanosarcinales archaeon]|nr:30S ribosomal protein S19e [Methanosarcinales archaeon]